MSRFGWNYVLYTRLPDLSWGGGNREGLLPAFLVFTSREGENDR